MNDERISLSDAAAIAARWNKHLYRRTVAAARRGDRAIAERLFLIMRRRGAPDWQEREVIDALFPLVGQARGFLTSGEQQRALRRFEQRRRP